MRLYRVARPAPYRRNLAKTLAWMLVVWTLALVALPAALRGIEVLLGIERLLLPFGRQAGAALLVAASAFGVWCAFTMARGEGTPVPFDAAARLVVTGPYRYVRNPMALSGITQTAGVALLLGSPLYYAVPLAGALLWHVAVRPSEERFLEELFGSRYRAYRAEVPLWLPRRPRSGAGPGGGPGGQS